MSQITPEMRLWRTDEQRGRGIHALLSNDPLRPSPDDPLIGTMESAIVAEDVVSTHNGAIALYGKRYAQVMATAEVQKASSDQEVYFQINPGEREQLLQITRWLNTGPFRPLSVVEKLQRVING